MRTAHRFTLTTAAAAAALLALAAAGPVAAAPSGAAIPLNTGQEVAKVTTGASGSFSYTISGDEFCYTLTARNLSEPAVAAHIHFAPRHVAGPVVIPLSVGSGTDWTVEDCVTVNPDLAQAISAHPRHYYVNVHTPAYPGGEIRGQLK